MNTTIKIIGAVIVFGLLGYFVGMMFADNQNVPVVIETETIEEDEVSSEVQGGEDEVGSISVADPAVDPSATILAGSETEVSTVDNEGNTLVGGDAVATPTEDGVFEATILAGGFYYDIEEIKVKEGDTVRLTLRSVEGSHNFALDEFGVESPVVSGDEETVIEFVADKKGTFEYYCSVGSHRELGQVGTLIVE